MKHRRLASGLGLVGAVVAVGVAFSPDSHAKKPSCHDSWSSDWNVGTTTTTKSDSGGTDETAQQTPQEQQYGPINLVLQDDGKTVTGTYMFSGKAPGKGTGIIHGSLDSACGSTLNANWEDATGHGTLSVTMQQDGATFTGTGTVSGKEPTPFWGHRVPFRCVGKRSPTPSTSGSYYLTSFGCWVDGAGKVHADDIDSCKPAGDCFKQAKDSSVCKSNETGPQCEERINWFTADVDRFGCLARLRITNPDTGKSVIAVALDVGPSCSAVESRAGHEVLDGSGRVSDYLFGDQLGWRERKSVQVEEVGPDTPLGPEQ